MSASALLDSTGKIALQYLANAPVNVNVTGNAILPQTYNNAFTFYEVGRLVVMEYNGAINGTVACPAGPSAPIIFSGAVPVQYRTATFISIPDLIENFGTSKGIGIIQVQPG